MRVRVSKENSRVRPRHYVTGRATFAGYRTSEREIAIQLPGTFDVSVEQIGVDRFAAVYTSNYGQITSVAGTEIDGPLDQVMEQLYQRFEKRVSPRKFTDPDDMPVQFKLATRWTK